MHKVYLLLGCNIGDRLNNLNQTLVLIEKYIGKIISLSSIYETAPWGIEHGNMFLNQAVCVETAEPPREVLSGVLKIELMMGRDRTSKGLNDRINDRIMDIDILLYNDIVMDEDNLTIPHPHLHNRRFALIPLAEIAPDKIHPKLKKTISVLLKECEDDLEVKIMSQALTQNNILHAN